MKNMKMKITEQIIRLAPWPCVWPLAMCVWISCTRRHLPVHALFPHLSLCVVCVPCVVPCLPALPLPACLHCLCLAALLPCTCLRLIFSVQDALLRSRLHFASQDPRLISSQCMYEMMMCAPPHLPTPGEAGQAGKRMLEGVWVRRALSPGGGGAVRVQWSHYYGQ